jgi:hypothetical protein
MLYPRPPAPAPSTSIPLALNARLQLHILIEEKGVPSFSGMKIDFALQFLHEHSVTLTGRAVPVIA